MPNRRDEEVRRLLHTPHPVVPADLAARAMLRGRRVLRRRRVGRTVLWALLLAAVAAAVVLAVLTLPHSSSDGLPGDAPWWSAAGPGR